MIFVDLATTINAAAVGGARYLREEDPMELLRACEQLKRASETQMDAIVRIMFGVSYN